MQYTVLANLFYTVSNQKRMVGMPGARLFCTCKAFEFKTSHLYVQSVLTIKGASVQAIYTCLDGILKKFLVAE